MKRTNKLFIITTLLTTNSLFSDAMKVSDVESQYATKPKVIASEELQQTINAGFSRTSGNTETLNFTGKYNIAFMTNGYNNQELKTAFETSLYITKHDNVRDNEEYTGILGLEQTMNDDWLSYTSFNWLRNKFLNYDNKTSFSLGLGKEFCDSKKHSLKFKIGMGYNIEDFANNQQTDNFGSLNEYLEYNNQLNKISAFYFKVGSMQRFDQFTNDYEILSVTGFNFNIAEHLSLSLEQEIRYDNLPATGFKKTDSKSLVRVGYSF